MGPSIGTYRQAAATADVNANVAVDHGCELLGVQGLNAKAATIYIKLYKTIAGVTPASTDTPHKVLPCPASAVFAFDFPRGIDFPKNLSYRVTTGAADNDTGALAANDFLQLNLDYR